MEQISLFDFTRSPYKTDKPIGLIELFAGYGSTAMALKRLGVEMEHILAVEIDKYAIASYNAVHGTDFPTMDVKDIKGSDLGISDSNKYTFLLTHYSNGISSDSSAATNSAMGNFSCFASNHPYTLFSVGSFLSLFVSTS